MSQAAALGRYRVEPGIADCSPSGGPWGSGAPAVITTNDEVEAFCPDTGYPQTRFDAGALAAAEFLRRVGRSDIAEMGVLLAQTVPPVPPSVMLAADPKLTGRVVPYR